MATQAQIDAFFAKWAPLAQQVSTMTGVPASVILAQSGHESSYGTSVLAQQGNNLFGVKKGGSWTGPTIHLYDTMEKSYSDYRVYDSPLSGLLDWTNNVIGSHNYDKARTSDPFASIQAIKAAGYATDPNYVAKLTGVIQDHNLTRYDVSGGSTAPKLPTITLVPDFKARWGNGTPISQETQSFMEDVTLRGKSKDYLAAIQAAQKAGYAPNALGEITFPVNAPFISGNTYLQDLAMRAIGFDTGSLGGSASADTSGSMTTTGHLTMIALIIGVLVIMVIAVFRMFPAAGSAAKTVLAKTASG